LATVGDRQEKIKTPPVKGVRGGKRSLYFNQSSLLPLFARKEKRSGGRNAFTAWYTKLVRKGGEKGRKEHAL